MTANEISSQVLCIQSNNEKIMKYQCRQCGWNYKHPLFSITPNGKNIQISNCYSCNPNLDPDIEVCIKKRSIIGRKFYLGEYCSFIAIGYNEPIFFHFVTHEEKVLTKKKKRDNQMSRVYNAEHQIEKGIIFSTCAEMQEYADNFLSSSWIKDIFPSMTKVLVSINRRELTSMYNTGQNSITITQNSKNQMTLLHELTHKLIYSFPEYFINNIEDHGPLFTFLYLKIIEFEMGIKQREALENAFKEFKVEWKKGEHLFEEAVRYTRLRKSLIERYQKNKASS